eukprot:TRINITY_DN30626_c0_g1_i1.p1 TRINITY_DN30626_c0_g1~~TRINITY_DN30626_c0_g1_i1.p1  ORF type:complete len:310 (+),score=92.62 TRINITY_DN30626_c0_g1_i1:76-930(+)
MCWNVEVSALSALVGWAACFYLYNRGGPRDGYYARYLLTYTFTQLFDIILWSMHEDQPYAALQGLKIPGGLTACSEMQYSFKQIDQDHPQYANFMVTKYVLPCIVFSQYCMQCTYPSSHYNKKSWHRPLLIASQIIPAVTMSFFFACSHLVQSFWPEEKMTLHWGGDWGWSWDSLARGEGEFEYWATQGWSFMSAVHCSVIFYMIMEQRVFLMHVAVLSCVVGFQAITESTIGLGSKWCTYCLVYSLVYSLDPIWYGKEKVNEVQEPLRARSVDSPPTAMRRRG